MALTEEAKKRLDEFPWSVNNMEHLHWHLDINRFIDLFKNMVNDNIKYSVGDIEDYLHDKYPDDRYEKSRTTIADIADYAPRFLINDVWG